MSIGERPRGSAWPTLKPLYNSLPTTCPEDALGRIAKDIRPKLRGSDSAIVMVWDEDRVSYNPTAPFVNRVATKEGGYVLPAVDIVFALTPRGASNQGIAKGIPVGQYEIRHE